MTHRTAHLLFATAWRWLAMLLAILALLAIAALFAPSGAKAASYGTGCASSNRTWSLYATNYDVTVAFMHRIQTKCWNARGYLTSTHTQVWFDKSAWGKLAGVSLTSSQPYKLTADHQTVRWQQDFAVQSCFAYFTMFCGPSLRFRTITRIMSPNTPWVGNVTYPQGPWYWRAPWCINKACSAGTPNRLEFRR